MKQIRRSPMEYFAVTVVVGLAMVLSVSLYAKRDQLSKSYELMRELQTLRNYVTAYLLEHHKSPKDLSELGILNPSTRDPFGNAYTYDDQTGWVSSTTSGYQNW